MELNFQRIKKSFSWLLFERVILMLGALMLSVIFAKELGPEQFGHFSYLMSFMQLISPLFALGMANVLMREFAASPHRVSDILATAFKARMIAGLIITPVVSVVLFLLYGSGWQLEWVFLLLLVSVSNCYEVFQLWFQYHSFHRPAVIFKVANFVIFAVLKLIIIFLQPQISLLLMIVMLEIITRNIGLGFLFRSKSNDAPKGQFDRELFKAIFSQTRFLILATVFIKTYQYIDVLMLQHIVDSVEVANYTVASKISEVWVFLPQVFVMSVFPALLNLANSNRQQYLVSLQKLFDILFVAAIVICCLVSVFSSVMINSLYGQDYAMSDTILQIHIFSVLFVFMRVLASQYLVVEKMAKFSLFSHMLAAISNVLLNLWLIPLYGAIGASISTLISYSLSSYFCFFLHSKTQLIAIMMSKSVLFPLRLFSWKKAQVRGN